MALGLNVSQQTFQERIDKCAEEMGHLQDVIQRYENAKKNLSQFIAEGDSNYDNMVARIEENVKAAKKAYNALNETKVELEKEAQNLSDTTDKIGNLLDTAKEAAKSVIDAALKIDSVL